MEQARLLSDALGLDCLARCSVRSGSRPFRFLFFWGRSEAPSPARARPLARRSLDSPSQQKPRFPQRLPDAAAPRRLCFAAAPTQTPEGVGHSDHLRRPLSASGPTTGPRPSAPRGPPQIIAVEVPHHACRSRGAPEESDTPRATAARQMCDSRCSASGAIWGGFASALLRASSLGLAPAQSARRLEGGKRGMCSSRPLHTDQSAAAPSVICGATADRPSQIQFIQATAKASSGSIASTRRRSAVRRRFPM